MSKTIWDESDTIRIRAGQDLAIEILKARGLNPDEIDEFIDPKYQTELGDKTSLPDIDKAVHRISSAINNKEKIAIYGDYDIDGLTATALLNDYFNQAGVDVVLYIPDRFEEGYGLNTKALLDLHKSGVNLVISVDCGTTAHEQIKKAAQAGLDIIVTDHHEPDNSEPKYCVACVNPKLSNDPNLRNLAGVGVAFYLVRALQSELNLLQPGQEKWLLDLVALGTICDIVPLTGDNRVLASFGLRVMRKTRRPGLRALAKQAGIDTTKLTESDLGFKLGPRLNAAGRLTHAKKALELLTTESQNVAEACATELGDLNTKRQTETKEIFADASKQAKKYRDQPVLVLSSPDWSHGIVGIVASRIAEKFHKPTILIQETGETAKGSARSYNKFNIIDAIRACEEVLDKFGGHSFAAGITLKTEKIEEFRYRINEYAITNMDVENNFRTISIGVKTQKQSPSIDMYDQLNKLAPFGNSNPRPFLLSSLIVEDVRLVGSDASHLRLVVVDSMGSRHTAIGFGMANNWPWLERGIEIDAVYELTENIWKDKRNHQLEIVDIRKKEHKSRTN